MTSLLPTVAYAAHDFRRNVRMVASTVFVVILPLLMYLMFGAMTPLGDTPDGRGNVRGTIMTSMATYGAIMATTHIAGSAAVERATGWGRQMALTPMRPGAYVAAKVLVGLGMAILPVLTLLIVGYATGARVGSPSAWILTFALAVGCSAVFALYGLLFGMTLRSEVATAVATGLLVIFAFFGNLFTPLSGALLAIARFTPIYGIAGLVRWPQSEGAIFIPEGVVQESLGVLVGNVGVWTLIFGVLCLVAARRRAHRR